jgi:hypothetical protein
MVRGLESLSSKPLEALDGRFVHGDLTAEVQDRVDTAPWDADALENRDPETRLRVLHVRWRM